MMLAGNPKGLFVESGPRGLANVKIATGKEGILVEFSDLSILAADLLKAAVVDHNASGGSLPDATEYSIEYALIVPTGIGLGPSHLPQHDAITLRFGKATLGIAIPRGVLLELGQAIAALGAAGSTH